jgi:predicted O-linked N-acetylglucosamine transferase (SPINDLY family)
MRSSRPDAMQRPSLNCSEPWQQTRFGPAHNNFGNALRRAGRQDEALASYRTAVAIAPGIADIWSNLGVGLHEADEHDEAEKALRRALTLQPNSATAHYNLGNLLFHLGRIEEAVACYVSANATCAQRVGDPRKPVAGAALRPPDFRSGAHTRTPTLGATTHHDPLRQELRPRMAMSPLMDLPTFASDLAAFYRSMWRRWCGAADLQNML